MNIAKTDPVTLAKQGNCKAIKFLIDRSLKGQGISSQAILKDNCLQVMLDGDPSPDSDKVAIFVYKGISSLSIPNLESLKVYGRKVGNKSPDWVKQYNFTQESIPETLSTKETEDQQVLISESMLDSNKSQDTLDAEPFMLECPGEGGSLVVTEKEIIFRRNGGFFSPYKKGEKIIQHTDVVSIQHQEPGFGPGYFYIQLVDTPATIKFFAASSHENAIVFMPEHNKLYENAYKYLSSKINPIDNNSNLNLHESEPTPASEENQDTLSNDSISIDENDESQVATPSSNQSSQAKADIEDDYSLEDIDKLIRDLCPENSAVDNKSNERDDKINIVKNELDPAIAIQKQASCVEPKIADDDLIFEGYSAFLILTKHGITLRRIGGLFHKQIESEKHILYKNITAIELKPVAIFQTGFIRFSFQGGSKSSDKSFNPMSDENTIALLDEKKTEEFIHAKKIIEQRMREATEPRPQASGGSDLDQLEKLASLRDKGIITEDEFQAKKKQILGL